MKSTIALFLLVLSFLGPLAEASNFRLTCFSIGAIRYTPQAWETSSFVDLGWTPIYELDPIAIRFGLGFNMAKDAAQQRATVTNYEFGVMLPIVSIFGIEASAGFRTWHMSAGGTHPEFGGAFVTRIGESIDRMYIGFVRYAIPGNPTNIFRVGTAFNL